LAPIYRLGDRLRYRRHGNLGAHGEDLAHRWLRRHGFTVAARNYRPPQGGGEIDIVAWEGDFLVFVEVKTRGPAAGSAPERAIDDDKIWALRRAARDYVVRAGADPGAYPLRRHLDRG
jgi:putative endonuclease